MKKIIIHPISLQQWPIDNIIKSKSGIGHIRSKYVANDTPIDVPIGENPDTILKHCLKELKQGHTIKRNEDLVKKRYARQVRKEERKAAEIRIINVWKKANLIIDPYVKQLFLIDNDIKVDTGFINQKQLISRRKEFGIKTIAEAKEITPDKEVRKRSSAGYSVKEYLFSTERLRERILTRFEIEERKSYVQEIHGLIEIDQTGNTVSNNEGLLFSS